MSKVRMNVIKKSIPEALCKRKQWVPWDIKINQDERLTKVPINHKTGFYASVSNPETFGTFKQACRRYKEDELAGIGFVLTKGDPFVAIDLDKCRNPKTGKLNKFAKRTIKTINSYTEVSPSGKGIRIIAMGMLPGPGRNGKHIEIYDRGRYVTITGQCLEGFPKEIKKRPKTIKKLYKKYFNAEPTRDALIDFALPCRMSDEDIISKAINAANGKKFMQLWEGDYSEYKSRSEADLALYSMLAFWTKYDRVKCDDLFSQSGLNRDKWSKRPDYRKRTADKAFALCREVYKPDPRQGIKEKMEEMMDSLGDNPGRAISKILKNKTALHHIAILCKHDTGYYEAILQDLKSMGVTVRDIDSLKKAIKAEVKTSLTASDFDSIEEAELLTVKSLLPDAPVSDDLYLPRGWTISDTGVFREKFNKKGHPEHTTLEEIAPFPILIQGHLKNITDDTEDIRLIWLDSGKWITHTVDRVDIADARLIVKLSDYGCPVTSATANSMVQYLAAFEAVNKDILPQAIATYQLGWHGEQGKGGFLWGQNLITMDNKVIMNADIEKMPPEEWSSKLLFFKGRDAGEDQIARGFHKKGKFEKWLANVSLINKYPLVTFSIYAALAPPLLMILDEPNFVVDWAFPTSRGKTTTLKVSASCWGNPNQRDASSVIKSWDLTRVYSERALIAQRDLPLILDDTKRASNPQLVSKIIYDISSGQGRGRGSISGARETGTWRTIALSNGESKATSFTASDGGTHARVLSIWGPPFGKKNKKKAKLISKITKAFHKNYGHAGYRFIRYLLRNRNKWETWKDRYAKLVTFYQDKAGSNEVALRQSSYFAVIHLAAILAKKALGLSINYKKHLAKVFVKAIAETSEADRAKEALQTVISWTLSNRDSFWGSNTSNGNQPFGGWLGVIDSYKTYPKMKLKTGRKRDISDSDDEGDVDVRLMSVAFMPHQLDKFLKDKGYEPQSIIRTWKDKGWLDTKGETKGYTKKVHIDGARTRCYVIPKKVIEKMTR